MSELEDTRAANARRETSIPDAPNAPHAPNAPATGDALPGAPAGGARGETIMFLEPPHPRAPLAETTDYHPGAGVAFVFLALPALSALVGAALSPVMGAPLWLPLSLLLLIPLLLGGWWALGGVRLTREAIAFGQPLRPWSAISLDTVARLERHGPRLTIVTQTKQRYSFIPLLLARGAELRRRLLLSLPVSALDDATRAEAQRMLEGELFAGSGVADALTVRPRRWLPWTVGALALVGAVGAGALLIWAPALAWLALVVGIVALLALVTCAWLAQEVFISDRGVIARFTLVRLTQSVAWDDVRAIGRSPGEIALILRGRRALYCAGPGVLTASAARQMREAVSFYALDRGTPVTPRARH